jgi:hypothetical protein
MWLASCYSSFSFRELNVKKKKKIMMKIAGVATSKMEHILFTDTVFNNFNGEPPLLFKLFFHLVTCYSNSERKI